MRYRFQSLSPQSALDREEIAEAQRCLSSLLAENSVLHDVSVSALLRRGVPTLGLVAVVHANGDDFAKLLVQEAAAEEWAVALTAAGCESQAWSRLE